MKQTKTKLPILKYFLISVFLSLPLVLFFCLQLRKPSSVVLPVGKSLPENLIAGEPDLRIRPGYKSYESYIQRQLNKTLNPRLRKIWTTRDWDRKIQVFSRFFADLKRQGLLSNSSRCLCVGARVGQEVEALKRVGVSSSVGMDLVPYPPLVVKGDFHHQPFDDETFDFEFSNVFDHALYPEKFAGEIERTLRPGGVCVLHVAVSRRSDKYSANDLYNVEALVRLFRRSEVVHVRKVDGFGLDTEVAFRKKTGS
ncbi:PREDICTED: uncharacterized protein LOC104825540 [Tarenaya hassleriana]|uniref:uncharacterized protein LOC104825540 n=1 Tax=Tarenaya hassleriana TaxID=28532 RepID=UPI00053C738D|nr:PREDICTED: uncharacterized protein LOC104825540 [Tarenaya hassleriana]